ncbi:MAG: hypothetical protein NTV09_02785, partial [Bacteroidetes bacterium]|nr:hypothetical protein [Bacteroidota bacterium]
MNHTLSQTRNNDASGYGVWQFQEVFWGNDGREANFGILEHGDLSTQNLEKPCVDEFRYYLDANGHPPEIIPAQEPDFYYDPYHCTDFSREYFGTPVDPVTGTVTVDGTGSPIKDAVIIAKVYAGYNRVDAQGHIHPVDNFFYTFSQADGSYSITPLDPTEPLDPATHYIRWLTTSAIGAEKSEANSWEWNGPMGQFDGAPPDVQNVNHNFILKKVSLNLNDVVQNQTITSVTSPQTFQSQLTLTASINNIIQSGATAEFKAMDEVHVMDEFHAENGSDVHIYNEHVSINCDDIITASPPDGFRLAANSNLVKNQNSEIEIFFKKIAERVIVTMPISRFDFNRLKFTTEEIALKLNGVLLNDT